MHCFLLLKNITGVEQAHEFLQNDETLMLKPYQTNRLCVRSRIFLGTALRYISADIRFLCRIGAEWLQEQGMSRTR